jgi:amidase
MDTPPDAARVGPDRRSVLELAAASATGALIASAAPAAWAARQGSDIVLMEAHALSQAIATRKISCVEVMGAYLDQIERLNPKVNAIVALQDRSDRRELDCLQLAYAYDQATQWTSKRPPPLLART